jgi:WD40 repeat protein
MIVLKTKRQKIEQVVFCPAGNGFAAVGYAGAFWWPTITALKGEKLEERAYGVGFDPTGRYVVIGSATSATLHDLQEGTRDQFFKMHSGVRISASPIEPLFVISTMSTRVTAPVEGWRLKSDGKMTRVWSVSPSGESSQPVFAADGSWFVHFEFLGWERTTNPFQLVFRRPNTGAIVRREDIPQFCSTYPSVSSDMRCIAFSCGEYFVVRAVLEPGRLFYQTGSNSKHFTDVAFHPSNRFLAATSNDATVKFYDTQTWELAKTYTWDIGRMRSIAFSPDGTLAAAGSDKGKVVVWDVDL